MNRDHRLQNVYSGDDVRAVARASRIDALQQIGKSQTDGNQYSRSNIGRMVGPGWVVNRQINTRHFRGTAARTYPWKITISNVNNQPVIKVHPGTINGVLPSNMFDSFSIAGSGTLYVILNLSTDGDTITNAFISVGSSPPPPIGSSVEVAPTAFQILLGMTVDTKVFQIVDALLEANPLKTIQSLRESIMPGLPYWESNYTWEYWSL